MNAVSWWALPSGITLFVLVCFALFVAKEIREQVEPAYRLWPAVAIVAAFPLSLVWLAYFAACTAAGRVL
ncbi:MAG: hypothetical protein HZA93_23705 [Verrucomicrobia bacterium]|nr:hypothetical protein [Verrucomicrobiota bacterium]